MANKDLDVTRDVYKRERYDKVIDRDFNFYNEEDSQDTDTIQELFRLYEKLYLEIPKQGEINSHEYLIRKSSELVDIEKTTEEIEPLLKEITQLRQQLLEANKELVQLQTNNIENI